MHSSRLKTSLICIHRSYKIEEALVRLLNSGAFLCVGGVALHGQVILNPIIYDILQFYNDILYLNLAILNIGSMQRLIISPSLSHHRLRAYASQVEPGHGCRRDREFSVRLLH